MIDYEKICEANKPTYILPRWVQGLLGGDDAIGRVIKAIDRGLDPKKGIELLVDFGVPRKIAEKEIGKGYSAFDTKAEDDDWMDREDPLGHWH